MQTSATIRNYAGHCKTVADILIMTKEEVQESARETILVNMHKNCEIHK